MRSFPHRNTAKSRHCAESDTSKNPTGIDHLSVQKGVSTPPVVASEAARLTSVTVTTTPVMR